MAKPTPEPAPIAEVLLQREITQFIANRPEFAKYFLARSRKVQALLLDVITEAYLKGSNS